MARKHSDAVSYGPIVAPSGSPGSLKLSGREEHFIRLNVKGVPQTENTCVEMEYCVSLVEISGESPPAATCVLSNNQTLLVDISDTRFNSKIRAIAVITPMVVQSQRLHDEELILETR